MSKKLFFAKRSIFLFLTLSVAGLVVAFKGPLFHFALRTYVSHKIPLDGNWDFDYSYISFQEHGAAFHDISLSSEDKKMSFNIGKIFCLAPKIENISFSNHFIIEDLDISFAEKMPSKKGMSGFQIKSILSSLRQVEVKNGSISIPDQKINFSLGKSISPQKLGELIFSKPSHGLVKCDISSWADRLIVDIEARQSALVFYKEFADFFLGEKSSDWNIEKGRLDGRAFIAMSESGIKDMRLHMNLLDGKFRNETLGMLSSFDRVFVDLDYPTSSEEKSFIENIKINSSVNKGDLTVYNEVGETRFSLKDMTGFISASAFKEATIELSGFVDDQERLLPVKLIGKPAHKNRNGLELDLSLQLDPVFGERASVNVVCLHNNGDFSLTSRLDSLKVNQMLILQVGLGLLNPSFKDYTINKGSYSGDIHVLFNKDGVKDFSLRNLKCDDLGIYSAKDDVRVEAALVSGECEIDLFQEKKTIISDWQLMMKEAKCIIGQEGKLPFYVENVDMDVKLKDGSFIDSVVSAKARGINIEAQLEGSFDEPLVNLQAKTRGSDFLRCFSNPSKEYDMDVLLSAQIKKRGNKYDSSGVFSFLEGAFDTDVMFNASGKNLNDIDLKFSTDHITGQMFPYMNEVMGFSWSMDGIYAVKGRFKDKKLICDFEGEKASYRQKHSFIKEAKGKAHFVKDWNKDFYMVDVFLEAGHKKIIAGKKLNLQNAHLRLSSEESYFKVRDFCALVDFDEVDKQFLIRGNRFDIFENGTCLFDMQVEQDDLEICRFIGNYDDQKISLGTLSHVLDAPVNLKLCDFSTKFNLMLDCKLNLNDVPFPKLLREQEFGKYNARVTVNDSNYQVSLNDNTCLLKGNSEGFKLKIKDEVVSGLIFDDHIEIKESSFRYKDHEIAIDTLSLSKKNAIFNGTIKRSDLEYEGSILMKWDKKIAFEGKGGCKLQVKDFGGYELLSLEDFSFEYDKKGIIQDGKFKVIKDDMVYAYVSAKSIMFHDNLNKISFHGVEGKASHHLFENEFNIDFLKDKIIFSAEADIFLDEKDFWISANIDSQEFSYANHTALASGIHVRANTSSLIIDFALPLYGSNVDVSSHLFFDENKYFRVEGHQDSKKVLDLYGSLEDGVKLYRMKGDLVGLGFEITPDDTLKDSLFKCEMNLDLQKMKPILPEGVVEFVDRIGLGSGIEIVGELDVKKNFQFDGVVKGTDFDFFKDYSLSSLFGKLFYKDGLCTLSDFSVVDRSLMAECKEATFDTRKKGCFLNSKKFEIKNLRPCLLSKKGERKKVVNPFLLKTIDITDIHGDLADLDTLKGKGYLKFINSFERQTNPIFDFAKEIIGRIGLDPVLMIPVEGEMFFTLADQKLNFNKLHDTYSDKKRSYFYLWHKTNSFLDFDGNIHIDIRMKQFALLKFTELFIISLDGPLSSPKVFLK
ncbi:MAG: hypothetical protein S4CHLAM20_05040 [Chlamydiia bacterium]|nr:hypothetical protein [Chlamydiia bacterium]